MIAIICMSAWQGQQGTHLCQLTSGSDRARELDGIVPVWSAQRMHPKACWKFVIAPSTSSCTYAVYWTFPVEHELAPSHSTGYEPRALLGSVVLQVPLPLSHPSWLPYPPQFSMASLKYGYVCHVRGGQCMGGSQWLCASAK